MTYHPVIGLEIHIQAKTKSKMFCRCDANYFGDAPNTHVCPVCLGLPGALPVPNRAGLDQSIKLALALNCKISPETKFDRKNYFYPDLPKAYQISQYDQPVGYEGHLQIDVKDDSRTIRIRRAHLEEDTGKSIHEARTTLLDFNKSGVPLIEVVTEPDFEETEEVTAFAKLLRQTVQYLGVSDAEMQKGQMRFELNISLRPEGQKGLPNYRVEVKNIGSISVLEKVIEFEIARQTAELEAGKTLTNETRGLVDMTGETVSQRVKEQENDYRYFPEPDIPPIVVDQNWIDEIAAQIPELPWQRKQRFVEEYGLELQQAEIYVDQKERGDWFEQAVAGADKNLAKLASNYFSGYVFGRLEKDELSLIDLKGDKKNFIAIINLLNSKTITGSTATSLIDRFVFEAEAGSPAEAVEKEGLGVVADTGKIKELCQQAIDANPKVIESLTKNPNAYKALVGHVMRESKGQANPQLVDQTLRELLNLG